MLWAAMKGGEAGRLHELRERVEHVVGGLRVEVAGRLVGYAQGGYFVNPTGNGRTDLRGEERRPAPVPADSLTLILRSNHLGATAPYAQMLASLASERTELCDWPSNGFFALRRD
jgi:hypothetical protein